MRNVQFITVHCSGALPQNENRYHYTVKENGEITRHMYDDRNSTIGITARCGCISIAYTCNAKDGNQKPTPRQEEALFDKIVQISERHRSAKVIGAHELTGGPQPVFDVKAWLANYVPDLEADIAARDSFILNTAD